MASKQLCVLTMILGLGNCAVAGDVSAASDTPVRQAARVLKGKDRDIGRLIPNIEFQDVTGKSHQLNEFAGKKGVVIAVTSTSCPLSKKYLPTVVSLAKKYSQEGFAFILLNPTATDKADTIKEAAGELGDSGIYVHDQQGTLSSALELTSTTDALLLDPARTVRYQGAIDDQYGFGYALEAPRKNYLISAINEYLKGQPVAITATEAPGCHLALESSASTKTEITYHNRISRIVQSNCGECHREGGVAPFSLDTRADLVAHAGMIETVVNQGTMPPWFAVPPEGEKSSPWINDCSLNQIDKEDLLAWLKGDRPEGDAKDAVLPVDYAGGWTIGKPDLVVKFPKPVAVQATGVMSYKNVLIETGLKEDKWVQAIEVRPGAPEVVHHMLVFARAPGNSNIRGGTPILNELNYWGIYVPGNSKRVYSKGLARKLPKGTQIRLQIHYTPNGKATEDLSQVGFVFADQEPESEVKTASLLNAWFEIPPGAANHEDTAKIRLPMDVTVLGYLPHMHLRGKACSYEAVTPDGKTEELLDIPRYDFNWQYLYRYAEPRTFAKGTTLKFKATFDNSDKNPANPDPKSTVHWGEQTSDEMIVGYIEYFVPNNLPKEQIAKIEHAHPGLVGGEDELLFTAMDADDDGKLSVDEMKKIGINPRLRQANPQMIAAVFKGLDKNHDDYLSPEEFHRLSEVMSGRRR